MQLDGKAMMEHAMGVQKEIDRAMKMVDAAAAAASSTQQSWELDDWFADAGHADDLSACTTCPMQFV